MKLETERSGGSARLGKGTPDGREAIRGQKGIRVEEEKHVARCSFGPAVHLDRPALVGREDRRSVAACSFPRSVSRASVDDDRLKRLLCVETTERRANSGFFIQCGNDDRDAIPLVHVRTEVGEDD